MKKTFLKKHISPVILLAVFSFLSFAQYGLANTWQPPASPIPAWNVPAPLNVGTGSQIKGGDTATIDSAALAPDPDVTLTLKKTVNSAGLFTEGFLSFGTIPTLGYISASVAQIAGTSSSTSRSPLFLYSGANAPMTSIVLSNLGGTNTKRLGVWSQKDNGWANTRIKNGYFSNLIIGGDGDRSFSYMAGGPQKTTASYTKRFMGFLTLGGVHPAKPSPHDPDFNLNVPEAPPGTYTDCQQTSSYGPLYTNYEGTHKFCYVGGPLLGNHNFMYEAVPVTTLDVAGKTSFGDGGTCIVRNTDECPLGSYLQKIGSFNNNLCKAFTGTCVAPNTPFPNLSETVNGNGEGDSKVAWMRQQYIGPIGGALSCNGVNWASVATSPNYFFFPNLAESPSINLASPFQQLNQKIVYNPSSQMMANPTPGDYRVLFNNNNPKLKNLNQNHNKYIIRIHEGGIMGEVVSCP